jgi:hypothetical protein
MAKVETVNLTDGTGKTYEYGVFTPDTSWNDIGTVYGFLKKNPSGTYTILYIGKAASMSDRHDDHERWKEAVKKGATHIMARVIESESVRQAEEKALIAHYKPEMNTQHVKKGSDQRFGRG